jgi:integrase
MAKSKRARGTGSVYSRPRSPFLWISFYQNGKLIRESTGTDSKTKAQNMLTKRLQEVNSGTFQPQVEKITVAEIYKHVLADYIKNQRPALATLKGRWHPEHGAGLDRKGTRTTLREFFGHLRCNQVTYTLLERFQVIRLQEGAAPGSVNRELNILKKAFDYALKAGEVRTVPPFPKSLPEAIRNDFITDTDYPKFAAACLEVGGLWMRGIFELAYTFGMRHGELLRLRVRNVNVQERTIQLFPNETKTGKGRLLPMADDTLFNLVLACIEGKGQEAFVFTRDSGKPVRSFSGRWAAVCRVTGKKVRFHALRRSAVTAMVNSGIPEKEVMAISGHESRSVFQRYHIVPPQRLRTTMQTLAAKRAENLQQSEHAHIEHTGTPPPKQAPAKSKTSDSVH